LLRDLKVRQLGTAEGDFANEKMPFAPTRSEDLSAGGNFRLETALGVLDIIMQWIPGIEAEHAYPVLAADAEVPREPVALLPISTAADQRSSDRVSCACRRSPAGVGRAAAE
jgi:hypothetical protein